MNKGCGGDFIYLCFTRDAATVINGIEYLGNRPFSRPTDLLTEFQAKIGSSAPATNNYFKVWQPDGGSPYSWYSPDLNKGAGGEWIFTFQSKDPAVSYNISIAEVGILSGNSSTIQPPSGWKKLPLDLNAEAGGDFIYFCYR